MFNRRWFQILISGVVLFFIAEQMLRSSGNTNFLPAVILLGALVVPVSFVTYFYGQERLLDKNIHGGTPLKTAALNFSVGGLIGVIVAAILEYGTLSQLNASGLLFVALIEEAAKMIFPLVVYIRARLHYRTEIDGLLFGTAAGMGFAALETMGYGIVALIQSKGSFGSLEEVLLLRGLLSPVGHGAWTGLICAALWHKREQTGKAFNASIIGVYFLAVMLHFLWDVTSLINLPIITILGYVVIGAISLTLLVRRMREARLSSQGPNGKNAP
jgi:RsiW-degrading membrane proteinase PrsW (M82 family)